MTSPLGRILPGIACQPLGIPEAEEKCTLINQFIKTQKTSPHLKWAFEINKTTALHEIIGNTCGTIFFPNKQYWINRIVREGGVKVINWCRSSDKSTPLHLVNSSENADLLIRNGAETHILNSYDEFAIQKIACSPSFILNLSVRSAIFRIFLKYRVPIGEWGQLSALAQEQYNRVKLDVKIKEQTIIQFFNAHTFANEENPLCWLPREIIYLVASYYFFY